MTINIKNIKDHVSFFLQQIIVYMVTFSTQLVHKKYYAIYLGSQSTFGVFCQFYTF